MNDRKRLRLRRRGAVRRWVPCNTCQGFGQHRNGDLCKSCRGYGQKWIDD